MKRLIAVIAAVLMLTGFASWTPEHWTVADNWWGDTRPVYSTGTDRVEVARAPEGAVCGQSSRDNQTGATQWREWTVDGQVVGEVYCSGPVPPAALQVQAWVTVDDFFGYPQNRTPVFAGRALSKSIIQSGDLLAWAPAGAACGPVTRRDQTGDRQWRLWRNAEGRAIGETLCRPA